MKIAITSSGKGLNSLLDQRFARAPYFLIVDSEKDSVEVIDNTSSSEISQGAGPVAVETIAKSGVDALITGHIGPNAYQALKAAGIKVYSGESTTVAELISKFKKGELRTFEGPDVSSHWR